MKRNIFIACIFLCVQGFSQNVITPELLWKLGRVSEARISPDGKNVLYGITYYNLEENKGNRDLYIVPVDGGTPKKITDTKESEYNAIWRPDGKKIGYISSKSGSMQVWEMNPDGSGKKQISQLPNDINGFEYSPKGDKILFTMDVKCDSTVQDLYPDLPKANAMLFDDLMYRHWDSWTDYSVSHIFYAAYDTIKESMGIATDIMKNEFFDSPLTPDGGMEQICWSPDGNFIAYTCKKLKGRKEALSTNSDIFLYDLKNKTTTNISQSNYGYDMDPVFSPDGKKIVWNSMKTPGFEADKRRIMLYDADSKTLTDLSENFDQSATNFHFDPLEPDIIYFISGINATYQIYRVNIKTKKIEQITKGIHDYTDFELANDNSGIVSGIFPNPKIIGTKMSMSMPTEIFKLVYGKEGYKENQITFTNKEILSKVSLATVEERWITTTDNKKMLTWVILPPDFDKTKKYPAILYCQGGPQSAVSQFFSYRWNFQIMAANGYIVVAPNRRGLPTFGQEWNDEISQDYGGQNMKDYLSAIDSVSEEPYVDKDHMGAVGASYGGFSVYWLAGNHNKRFKAFIAHCGMFNFESWYGSTEEMWFANYDLGGPYWKKPQPKSYSFSPHKFVGNWDTPILIIEGGNDFRIPYTQGLEAFNAAQLQGIPSELLYFPEETHFVLKPQNSVLWQRVFFKWLDRWLKPAK